MASVRRPAARRRLPCASEADEQRLVVRWLQLRGHVFFHCSNQSRSARAGVLGKALGVVAGVPDLWVLSAPTRRPRDDGEFAQRWGAQVGVQGVHRCSRCMGWEPFRGVAIEMKRTRGGRVSPQQKVWLAKLTALGWYVVLAKGAGEAIAALQAAGY